MTSNPVLTQPAAITSGLIRCANDVALSEARAVLADMTSHSDQQIATAARDILRLSQDETEWSDAFEALRTINQLELIP